ncbi:histidine triad (HIT) protein [Desulfotomaculum nigrificans CO-1-SRB]|uniref:Histidine triad (HIT) protein n=1 Tax=Desulfotomaculum nigrificans (strain DSM 14880 / VKM B-2319 / CO-1-SRB) TaxID=868595 RepID=F6B8F6_DESCC|nr:histidine triad nucleotide-binding protein [Desulfotomaculum nigrificans]AEF94720.1 histidine triad (HIT) protein [Desulfotomaculum nigrificans CO-1-SRB]
MQDCLFCKIIAKEIPAQIVYEDDRVLAFKDINPVAPVHVLIIPKKHISTLLDLHNEDAELIGHIFLTCAKLAKEMGLADNGFRVVSNCKEEGGQTVFHLHFHLLGGRPMEWPPG